MGDPRSEIATVLDANLYCSVSNLGGTFPRFFILKFVDMFTKATCTPPADIKDTSSLKGALITQPFSCVLEAEKHRCIDGGGTCNIERDGKSYAEANYWACLLI